ncbi:MAG: hypothetical protein ACI8ZN_001081 [Bacteroidia bacterium]|jgi:hypothetical protein
MKLRILDNTIRLRLTQKEVDLLATGEPVLCATHFANNALIYSIKPLAFEHIDAEFANNVISVKVNRNLAKTWAESDDISLETKPGVHPYVLIEKDFKCLTERNEDESDLFENPNVNC